MGLLQDSMTGLSAIYQRDQQRNAQEQSVLLELVTAVPELMDNPEVAGALGKAFQYNPGIPSALTKLKEARRVQQLSDMKMKLESQRAIADLQFGNEVEQMAAASGLPGRDAIIAGIEPGETPRDDLLMALGDMTEAQKEVAKAESEDAAAAKLASEVWMEGYKHRNDLELAKTKAQITGGMIGGAIKGVGGIIAAGQKLTNTPPMTPGAEKASENLSELQMERLRIAQSQLLQVATLDQILREDDGIFGIGGGPESPGIAKLYGLLQTNPQGFSQLYGEAWDRAKEDTARTMMNPDLQQAMLARNDIAPLNLKLISDTESSLKQIEADRRRPELNDAVAGVSKKLADVLGVDFPELVQQVPPMEVEEVPSPYISMEEMPSDIQRMYLEAEGMPELQTMYQQIIGSSRGQWDIAYAAMGYLRSRVEYYMENPPPQGEVPVTQ